MNPYTEKLVAAAILAPSSHNTQPWRFIASGSTIELFADLSRALPENDPDNRELYISCGAALTNLRIAAAHHGIRIEVVTCPDDSPDCLVRITLTGESVDSSNADLFPMIPARRTSREAFQDRVPDQHIINALMRAAFDGGVKFCVCTSDQRSLVAALVEEGDRLQWSDAAWRAELANWIHSPAVGDGLARSAAIAPSSRWIVRHCDLGKSTARKDRKLAEHAPLLAIICSEKNGPQDWLHVGEVLQRVLLVARKHGLQAGYLNQPVQVHSLRDRLKASCGLSVEPQLVIRLGHGMKSATPRPIRRPVQSVLICTEPGLQS